MAVGEVHMYSVSKKDSPKTLGTRVSCKTGTWLNGQRARQA